MSLADSHVRTLGSQLVALFGEMMGLDIEKITVHSSYLCFLTIPATPDQITEAAMTCCDSPYSVVHKSKQALLQVACARYLVPTVRNAY